MGKPKQKTKIEKEGETMVDVGLGGAVKKKRRIFRQTGMRRAGIVYGEETDFDESEPEDEEKKVDWAKRLIAWSRKPRAKQPSTPWNKTPCPVWLLGMFLAPTSKRAKCLSKKCVDQDELTADKGCISVNIYYHLRAEHPKRLKALILTNPHAAKRVSVLFMSRQNLISRDQRCITDLKEKATENWTQKAKSNGDVRMSMLVKYKPTHDEIYGEVIDNFDLPSNCCPVCGKKFNEQQFDEALACLASHTIDELEELNDRGEFSVCNEFKRQVNASHNLPGAEEAHLLEKCSVYVVVHAPEICGISDDAPLTTAEFLNLIDYTGKYEVRGKNPIWERISLYIAGGIRRAWRSKFFKNGHHPIISLPSRTHDVIKSIVFNWQIGMVARLIPLSSDLCPALGALFESMFISMTSFGLLGSSGVGPVLTNRWRELIDSVDRLFKIFGHQKGIRIGRQLWLELLVKGTVLLHRSMNDDRYKFDWHRYPHAEKFQMVLTDRGKFRTRSTIDQHADSQTPRIFSISVGQLLGLASSPNELQLGIGSRADNGDLLRRLRSGQRHATESDEKELQSDDGEEANEVDKIVSTPKTKTILLTRQGGVH